MSLFAAFSGGKDSTAMVLAMWEAGERPTLLFTPTGNELPGLLAHIDSVVAMTGLQLVVPENRGLAEWISHYEALPNWRQRWCTRQIKIEPCKAHLLRVAAETGEIPTLCVGLRADEEERTGLYGDYAHYRYPLRERGWGVKEVWGYLNERGVSVPARTDCAVCPYQRLGEWWALWRDHPEAYAQGEAWEAQTGHTFRSPGRDSWPAGLAELRAEFERGRVPRGAPTQSEMFSGSAACRVCSL